MPTTIHTYGKVGPYHLTPKQARIYRFIAAFFAKHTRTPTLREIGAGFGIVSPNGVLCHTRALAKKGVIRINESNGGTRHTARGIELVGIEDAVRRAVAEQVRKVLGNPMTGER